MVRVGLTGGIASGKTLVADELAARGAVVIDADVLAREVVEPGTPGLAAVVERFGADVLTDDGRLDRAALGRIVFADPEARRDLERIIHPAVRRPGGRAGAAAADRTPWSCTSSRCWWRPGSRTTSTSCVVVDVDPETQRRAAARRATASTGPRPTPGSPPRPPREQRLAAADIVLDNAGTVTELREQIDRLWDRTPALTPRDDILAVLGHRAGHDRRSGRTPGSDRQSERQEVGVEMSTLSG